MRRFKYFLLAALLLCLSGCQLAQPEAQTQADMLVGVMLTPEPLDLFDWEGYAGQPFRAGRWGGLRRRRGGLRPAAVRHAGETRAAGSSRASRAPPSSRRAMRARAARSAPSRTTGWPTAATPCTSVTRAATATLRRHSTSARRRVLRGISTRSTRRRAGRSTSRPGRACPSPGTAARACPPARPSPVRGAIPAPTASGPTVRPARLPSRFGRCRSSSGFSGWTRGTASFGRRPGPRMPCRRASTPATPPGCWWRSRVAGP